MKRKAPLFRGSVLAELVSRTLFVGIVILFVYGGFSYYVSKKTFDAEMGDRLLAIARLASNQSKFEWIPFLNDKGVLYEKYRVLLEGIKKESQAKNLFILDLDGRVLVDANGKYDFKENNWLRALDPEPFLNAKRGTPSVSILFPESDGGIYKIGYSPITMGSKVIAVLGVEASATFMQGLNEFARVLFSFGLICLLLMGGLLYAFGRRFIHPIEEMAKASQKVAEGDFSRRVRVNSVNELGALAHAFNEMTERLQSHNEYILESMSNGLLVLDLEGKVVTFNRAASQILGLPQQRVIGLGYEKAFAPYPQFLADLRAIHQRQSQGDQREINLSEENPKFLRIRGAPLLGADSQELGTEVLFTDETELRRLQERIKASEKMATIGELAAGIAHEIRNPLGAMKGFTEILRGKLKDRPEAKEMVADIATEIEILNKIVTNFLVFARPTALETQDVRLSEVVLGVLPLIEKDAELKGVRVVFEQKNDTDLLLDLDQFRRAILNLALNAIQATPPEGEIRISASGFSRPELVRFLAEKGLSEMVPAETRGAWAAVWVEDRGMGIAQENLKKLFNPFFTTKTEGFGLGLSITKKILEAMDGNVAGINRPEGGALFAMILPVAENMREAD